MCAKPVGSSQLCLSESHTKWLFHWDVQWEHGEDGPSKSGPSCAGLLGGELSTKRHLCSASLSPAPPTMWLVDEYFKIVLPQSCIK